MTGRQPASARTPKARHRRFLEVGFFPRELPTCFYTGTLALHRDFLWRQFSAVPPPKGKVRHPAYFHFKAEKANVNLPRFGREDRRHSYINPISFFVLSKVLADNYVKLRSLNRKSALSVSASVFDWKGRRTFAGPAFGPRDAVNASLNARFEVLAEADINGFYHSIYTHAVAWAIHGKDVAKARRSDYNLFGNVVDLLVRNAQDGQTIGLPVGPDTSRLIAEVLGSAIDVRIMEKLGAKATGRGAAERDAMRFVDDYLFGCTSLQHAQAVTAAVREAVNAFELELNPSKTGSRTSAPFVSGGWKDELAHCLPRDTSPEPSTLRRFLYNVHVLARDNPSSDVVNYALQSARTAYLAARDWTPVQDYLLSAYREAASVLPQLVTLTILRQGRHADVPMRLLSDFANARIPVLVDLQKDGEIVWLLFLCICLGIRLHARAVQRLVTMESGAVAVMVADAVDKGLVAGTADLATWNRHLNADGLHGPMWLYVYESTLKRTNGVADRSHVATHPYFKHLLTKRVEFYRSGPTHLTEEDLRLTRRREQASARQLRRLLDDDAPIDFDDFEPDEEEDEEVYS